jgi:hypothetical protein
MRKSYLVLVTAAGLLLAVGASAEAGGRAATGGPSGPAFNPPGWSNSHWSTTNQGSNNTLATQPPGWSHNLTGQTNAGWSGTISGTGGGIPHGLNTH